MRRLIVAFALAAFMAIANVALAVAGIVDIGTISGLLFGIGFEDESSGVTAAELAQRPGSRIVVSAEDPDGGEESVLVGVPSESQIPGCGASPPFSGLGSRCLEVRTDLLRGWLGFSVSPDGGSLVISSSDVIMCYDVMAKPTALDELVENLSPASPSVQSVQSVSGTGTFSLVGGGRVVVSPAKGLVCAVDKDIAVYPYENEEGTETNWVVHAGVRQGTSVVPQNMFLKAADGGVLPPLGEGWHRLTFVGRMVSGHACYEVYIDGVRAAAQDDTTNFLALSSSPLTEPVRSLFVSGRGLVDDIVVSGGEPEFDPPPASGGLPKPKDVCCKYDGESHMAVTPSSFYVIEGENEAVDVGSYEVWVTPHRGICWEDGTTDAVAARMIIAKSDSLAGTVMITGAPVSYFGAADAHWIDNGNGSLDMLLKFTDVGSFSLPGTTQARILAVGGGGGGGATYAGVGSFGGYYGGGGGGGAGGMVESNGLFAAASYTVDVGSGGRGGVFATSSGRRRIDTVGVNGEDTLITCGAEQVIVAYGGGGGGGETEGLPGGSGGGGSQYRATNTSATPNDGGANLPMAVGQGCCGGTGDVALYGGGGGGANGAGGKASSRNPVGGTGRVSNITGSDAWYAGGGGGGHSDKSITTEVDPIAGGVGGGGRGGVGMSVYPTAGQDGTGGGGGGCCANKTETNGGADGGSGIVYVRIASAMVGEFKKPTDPAPVVYDGNEHVSVRSTVFYDVTGENVGTDAGTYVAVATLKPGVCWPDGTTDDVTVTMRIEKRPVAIAGLHIDGWTFGTTTVPEPRFTVDPAWASIVYEYARSEAQDVWTTEKPVSAGNYVLRATVSDTTNFTCTPAVAAFAVAKAPVTISDLRLRDWMAGTPVDETPEPMCSVDPSWAAAMTVFEYADQPDASDWSSDKPAAVGRHYVRARVTDSENCESSPAVTSFEIIAGLGNVFRDYVELTVEGREESAGNDLVNFPYRLTLSEGNPVGFTYGRAGADGEDLAFTDANGRALDYEIESWNTNGESVVFVKVPRITTERQSFRLYWNAREGATVPDRNPKAVWTDWTRETQATVTQPSCAFTSAVVRDGRAVNYWMQQPQMSATFWNVEDPPEKKGVIVQDGRLAFGATVRTISNLVTGETYPDIPTDRGGNFRVSYAPDDPLGVYEALETHIDFAIIAPSSYDDLKGEAKTLTLSGRVMLANNDIVSGHEVADQAYWQTRTVVTNDVTGASMTNDVYWVHGGEEYGQTRYDMPNLLAGTSHWLKFMDGQSEKVLWRFKDVIIGNMYRSDGSLFSAQHALPCSPTQLGISSYVKRNSRGDVAETGNLILRNKANAAVYSPCYTNGIGTIYFDMVNAWTADGGETTKIVVEIATETADGLLPTDENASLLDATTIDGELGKIETWRPCTMIPLYLNGVASSAVRQPETTTFVPAVNVSGSTNVFYRICVNVNERRPVRFRIRRLSANEYYGSDMRDQILVDNIIVSRPAASVEMSPYGVFDTERVGRRTLGVENAMTTPFPSVTDETVFGRAQPVVCSDGFPPQDPAEAVVWSRMHYRWRSLDQLAGDWQSVDLSPGNGFRSVQPLNLPRQEGDVEFWYESLANLPFYEYFDYSGCGFGLGGLYSEKIGVVTNCLANAGNHLPSGGIHWFFRLRRGKSDFEDFSLALEDGSSVAMELVSDHLWRGCLRVAERASPNVRFHVEGRNRQVPGGEEFRRNLVCYRLSDDLAKFPGLAPLAPCETNGWSEIVADTDANYLCFRFNDETHELFVSPAECQDFNQWSDANLSDGRFVGRTEENGPVREYTCDIGKWPVSLPTNAYWNESFTVNPPDMQPGGVYEIGRPFASRMSPNGFTVGAGRWVPGNYADLNTGMAYQMEANGRGFVEYRHEQAPKGIESVSFRARMAQKVAFEDFSYYDGDKVSLTNYTFWCRAAYDVNSRRDFSGNASLSLAAFYRPGIGCYELRVEQYDATGASGVITGPGTGQQISLYRWNYDVVSGEMVAVKLGSTIVGGSNILRTQGEKGNYGLLFISAHNTGSQTEINAGVSWDVATVSSTASASCRWVQYVDSSDQRLMNGSYGVLSANCPSRFRGLSYSNRAQMLPTAQVNKFYTKDQSFVFPSSSTSIKCHYDIVYGGWAVAQHRLQIVDLYDAVYSGFAAVPVSQDLQAYLAPVGTTFWKPVGQMNVTSFADSQFVLNARSVEGGAVRIVTGGTGSISRNEVVIDDIEIRQWTGRSYDEDEGAWVFPDVCYGSPNDFVYTQGWISETTEAAKSCILSARRSLADVPTSIRTPLMDGADGRGVGLGVVSFSYRNAQASARLLLQVATNGVSAAGLAKLTKSVGDPRWVTVQVVDFGQMSDQERSAGMMTHYLGLRGIVGVARLVMDPAVVQAVATEQSPENFGGVEIIGMTCRDEPNQDTRAWIGVNMRTTSDLRQLTLSDGSVSPWSPTVGMALTLNNSQENDVSPEEAVLCAGHNPFVQTPVSTTDSFGEVQFVARKYDAEGPVGRITLFGQKAAANGVWTKLTAWTVDSPLFTSYSYKTVPGEAYAAFRLAVTGVADDPEMPDPDPLLPPVRVLVDDVVVLAAERTLAEADVTVENGEYTGEEQTASVRVSVGGRTLTEGVDYRVAGGCVRNAGRYELTVTGLGDFHGERTVSYRISKVELPLEKIRIGDPPHVPATGEPVWGTGFEADEEESFTNHVACTGTEEDMPSVQTYASLYSPTSYPGSLPMPFASCGERFLRVKTTLSTQTKLGTKMKIGANELVDGEFGEPIPLTSSRGAYVDGLVNLTAFDYDEDPIVTMPMQMMQTASSDGVLAISRPGCLFSVDDKLTLFTQYHDEEETQIDLRLSSCRMDVDNQMVPCLRNLLFEDGTIIPDLVDQWHRLTVSFECVNVESVGGVVAFSIYLDGRRLADESGETRFFSRQGTGSNDFGLSGLTLEGQGRLDDIVFGRGNPAPIDGNVYQVPYDGNGHMIPVSVVGEDDCRIRYSLDKDGVFSENLLVTNKVNCLPVWYEISSDNYHTYVGLAYLTIGPDSVDPIPDLGDDPQPDEIAAALKDSADPALASNIVDGTTYNAYRDWAKKLEMTKGVSAETVKSSKYAWQSFALDVDGLLTCPLADDDLEIKEFKPTSEAGLFEFSVSVKGVEVGSAALKENLKKVFGLDGASTLDGAAFSPDKVEIEFGTPEGGKVKFTAGPKDTSSGSFFMKVKLMP